VKEGGKPMATDVGKTGIDVVGDVAMDVEYPTPGGGVISKFGINPMH
jgi:hypothetical protein